MSQSKMVVAVFKENQLSDELKEQMWQLYVENYNDVTRQEFEKDLKKKNKLFIGCDKHTKEFAGFSAMEFYTEYVNGKKISVIYSGDTMIKKQYWGQKGLHNRFYIEALKHKLTHLSTPLYWFMVCMGYKTYLIMAKNSLEYWPNYNKKTPEDNLQVLNTIAGNKFGNAYDPSLNIINTKGVGCTLDPSVARITKTVLEIPEVSFFIKRNPKYAEGAELANISHLNLKWFLYITYKHTFGLLLKKLKKNVLPNLRNKIKGAQGV